MHKGVILLVKAKDRDEAAEQVDTFMNSCGYGDGNVWDWYVIGGRWSGSLNKLTNQFNEKIKETIQPSNSWGWTSQEIKDNAATFQKIWEELGGKGINPMGRDQYKNSGDENDDILPLAECFNVVLEWQQDPQAEFDKEVKQAEERYGKNAEKGYQRSMYAYYMKKAAELLHEDFCFDCNVFNTVDFDYSVPAITDGWFAVMVDMHN